MGEWFWRIELRVRRLRCFMVGHSERPGEHYNYEPDYCPKCFIDWPRDANELPKIFNRWYVWMVRRHWGWFDRMDNYLINNVKWLPSWWEY